MTARLVLALPLAFLSLSPAQAQPRLTDGRLPDCKPSLAAVDEQDARLWLAEAETAQRDRQRPKPRDQRMRSSKPCIHLASG
jgi:hypothetical protein